MDNSEDPNEEECFVEDEEDEEEFHNGAHNIEVAEPHDIPGPSQPSKCIVCNRGYTVKYMLFKWPVEEDVRAKWANAMSIPLVLISNESLICAFHFHSHQFSHHNGRIYWEPGTMPVYKDRRPVESLFPWERATDTRSIQKRRAPDTSRQSTSAPIPTVVRRPTENVNYAVSYRSSQFKQKSRNSHEVAVVSKLDSNIFYEFSYNRTSRTTGVRYYTCLGCRKAKATTMFKDVVRTIQIDGTVILSKGDPFLGHHYACTPLTSEIELRSIRPSVNQPMHMDMGMVYSTTDGHDIVYMDEEGGTVGEQWHGDDGQLIKIDPVAYFAPEEQRMIVQETIPCNQSSFEGCEVKTKKSVQRIIPVNRLRPSSLKRLTRRKPLPKCHICFILLSSTEQLITHLQNHVSSSPSCQQCGRKISPDDRLQCKIATCSSCYEIERREKTFG